MVHIGVDAHTSFSTLFGIDDATGAVVIEADHVPTTTEGFAAVFIEPMPCARAVVEASGISTFVAEMLRSFVSEVIIADPKVVRQLIRHSRPKTDMTDAQELAFQLQHDLIHPIYQHTPDNLALRALARTLRAITAEGTRTRNRIRSLLRQFGESCPRRDLCGVAAQQYLQQVSLREPADATLRELNEHLLVTQQRRQRLQRLLRQAAEDNALAELLRSIPGVGIQTAMTLISEVGEIERFDSVGAFINYCGLAPRIEQSGTIRRTGALTKGNSHLRLALIQAANALARQKRDTPLHQHYRRKLATLGKKKAKLDTARKIARVVYAIWRSGEFYRY